MRHQRQTEAKRLRKNAGQKVRDSKRRVEALNKVNTDWRCACCKEIHEPQIDHIHGGLQFLRLGAGHNLEAKILNGDIPASDCQILCGPCNRSKGDGIYCRLDHNA
jgi:hypothetical protein